MEEEWPVGGQTEPKEAAAGEAVGRSEGHAYKW